MDRPAGLAADALLERVGVLGEANRGHAAFVEGDEGGPDGRVDRGIGIGEPHGRERAPQQRRRGVDAQVLERLLDRAVVGGERDHGATS